MASLTWDEEAGIARVHFRYAGKQFKSLKTSERRKAEAMKAAIEETLHDLERGKVEMPAGADRPHPSPRARPSSIRLSRMHMTLKTSRKQTVKK